VPSLDAKDLLLLSVGSGAELSPVELAPVELPQPIVRVANQTQPTLETGCEVTLFKVDASVGLLMVKQLIEDMFLTPMLCVLLELGNYLLLTLVRGDEVGVELFLGFIRIKIEADTVDGGQIPPNVA